MLFGELLKMTETLYGNSDMPIVLTDSSLEMQWANPAALKNYPAIAYKDGIESVLSHYDAEKLLAMLRQGKTFSVEGTGEPLNVSHLTILPVVDGELTGCLFFLNEISQCHPGIQKDELQETILQSFAEGYKMPLTIIFSTLGLLAHSIDPDDKSSLSYIHLISQNCYRLYRLSNNLADSSRFRAGRIRISLQNGDLSSFLSGLCSAANVLTSASGIPLECEVPPRPVVTRFDPQRLSRAILNLISNACKFTREGNVVHVKLETASENAVITVSDKGAGMSSETLRYIFDPYFSFDPGGRPFGGCGLGLSIVKNIVAQHGGTVAVQSTPGEGTRVAFTLPIREDRTDPDYTAESSVDYLADRFSAIYVELSDVCNSPMP